MERRGRAFYQNAAENAKDPDAKKIFQIMAEEEEDHVKFLSQQLLLIQRELRMLKMRMKESFINGWLIGKRDTTSFYINLMRISKRRSGMIIISGLSSELCGEHFFHRLISPEQKVIL